MKKIRKLLGQTLAGLASMKLIFKPGKRIYLGNAGTSPDKMRPLFLTSKESKKLETLTYPTNGEGVKLVNDIK